MKTGLLALLLLLAALPPSASAGELAVQEYKFSYEEPSGLCPIDPSRSEAEKLLLQEGVESFSRFLSGGHFAMDCAYLDALRAGTDDVDKVTRVFGLGAVLQGGKLQTQRGSRREFVAQFGDFFKRLLAGDKELEQQLTKKGLDLSGTLASMGMDDLTSSRVIVGDPDTFYVAIVYKKPQMPVVFGITVLRGYVIAAILAAPDGGEAALGPLLAELRPTMQQVIAMNDPAGAAAPGPHYWLGVNWDRLPKWLWTALAIVPGLWWYYRRQNRLGPGGGARL